MNTQKSFRLNEETLKRYETLKAKENFEGDADFFRRLLDYAEIMQNQKMISKEDYNELQKKYEIAIMEVGRLQGELNVYKQIALPKKEEKKWWQFWKKYSTDSERARASEVTETDKDKFN